MKDDEILEKYKELIESSEKTANRHAEVISDYEHNTGIALMYVEENMPLIKKMIKGVGLFQRSYIVLCKIEEVVGDFDKVAVYKKLRRHGILDFFDLMLISMAIMGVCIYAQIKISDNPNITSGTPYALICVFIGFLFVFSWMRKMHHNSSGGIGL